MRNSKSQNPKSKQIPNSKLQSEPLADGWHHVGVNASGSALELKDELPDKARKASTDRPYDLQERTAVFGEDIVRFSKKIPRNPTNERLISQVVGAGTSVGANFCEASDSMSKKDFRHSAKRCIKEATETRHFLRMIVASEPALADEARVLYREATELILILGAMCK
jgi:four helix bundle protein